MRKEKRTSKLIRECSDRVEFNRREKKFQKRFGQNSMLTERKEEKWTVMVVLWTVISNTKAKYTNQRNRGTNFRNNQQKTWIHFKAFMYVIRSVQVDYYLFNILFEMLFVFFSFLSPITYKYAKSFIDKSFAGPPSWLHQMFHFNSVRFHSPEAF